ncbi:MAG: OmpP1/FadL family transporter, partial [Janthinobacterium lividum]
GGNGGNPFSQPLLIPSGYLSTQVADSRLWLGFGVSSPFGVKVRYDAGWFGRYDSLLSDLKTLNLQPTAAFKISDHLSIGGGVDIQTLHAELTSALPNLSPLLPDGLLRIKGGDLGFGWNAGILGDIGPVRLGLNYRSHITHDLTGKVQILGLLGPLAGSNGQTPGLAPISTPDIASVGAVIGNGRFRLLAGGSWYNWSRFNRIAVENEGVVYLDSPQNYRDTYSGSAAIEYDVTPRLTVRTGTMYDQTPTRNEYRTTRVPDGNRIWATTGATLHVNKLVAVTTSYAHVFVQARDIDRTDPLFAGTPAVIEVNTLSTNRGNVNIIASSLSLTF